MVHNSNDNGSLLDVRGGLTKVLAHGNGQCITDVDGDVFLRDGSYVKIRSEHTVSR